MAAEINGWLITDYNEQAEEANHPKLYYQHNVMMGSFIITLNSNGGTFNTNALNSAYGSYVSATNTTVKFGYGVPYQSLYLKYGQPAVFLTYGSVMVPTRTNYTFAGWSTSASGSAVRYGNPVSISSNALTLYAIWTANSSGGGGTSTYTRTVNWQSNASTQGTFTAKGTSGLTNYTTSDTFNSGTTAVMSEALWIGNNFQSAKTDYQFLTWVNPSAQALYGPGNGQSSLPANITASPMLYYNGIPSNVLTSKSYTGTINKTNAKFDWKLDLYETSYDLMNNTSNVHWRFSISTTWSEALDTAPGNLFKIIFAPGNSSDAQSQIVGLDYTTRNSSNNRYYESSNTYYLITYGAKSRNQNGAWMPLFKHKGNWEYVDIGTEGDFTWQHNADGSASIKPGFEYYRPGGYSKPSGFDLVLNNDIMNVSGTIDSATGTALTLTKLKYAYVYVNNAWERTVPFVYVNDGWSQSMPWRYTGSVWK